MVARAVSYALPQGRSTEAAPDFMQVSKCRMVTLHWGDEVVDGA